jgi:TolA-binding protein
MALARIAFKEKRWGDAELVYDEVANESDTAAAAEAAYWAAVSHYQGTNDHTALGRVAEMLKQKYPDDLWTKKASPWLGH